MVYVEEPFFDRTRELETLLARAEETRQAEFAVIYGRRRVGKTRLIERFIHRLDLPVLFITTTEVSGPALMRKFAQEIERQLGDVISVDSWNDLFSYFGTKLREDRLVIIIDEFQRIHEHAQDFIFNLQEAWDRYLRTLPLFLVISGSSMSMMRRIVLEESGPLYGRTTLRLPIKPFTYVDFREMFPEVSEAERVRIYSVFGGTPKYLQDFRRTHGSVMSAIETLLLTEHGALYREPINALDMELKSPDRYIAILDAIARGNHDLGEIASSVGLKNHQLTVYLKNLEDMLAITEASDPLLGKKKRKRHMILDPFFWFWFRFLYARQEEVVLGNTEHTLSIIERDLSTHCGHVFERIVRDMCISLNGSSVRGKPFSFYRAGSWWDRSEEIDLLLIGDEETYFVEAKFRNDTVDVDVLDELVRKSKKLESFPGRAHYIVVSKSGFSDRMRARESRTVTLLSLDEIASLVDARFGSEQQRGLGSFS